MAKAKERKKRKRPSIVFHIHRHISTIRFPSMTQDSWKDSNEYLIYIFIQYKANSYLINV